MNEVKDDILKSIDVNLEVGNITYTDAVTLRDLTLRLYEHIIKDYLRVGGDEDMSIRFDDALELPFADEIIRLHKELEERDKEKQEYQSREQEYQSREQEYQSREQEYQNREQEFHNREKEYQSKQKEMAALIESLQKQLADKG